MKHRLFLLMVMLMCLLVSMQVTMAQDDPADSDVPPIAGLALTDSLPEDGADNIATDAPLLVIFNRPVVPLGTIEEMRALPAPVVITPETAGTGEWVNTSIWSFQPETAWAGGQTYTISARPDLTAVDGTPLDATASASFSFTTSIPAVIGIVPAAEAQLVPLDQTVQVRFSMPVNQADAEAAFSLAPYFSDTADASVSGIFEWAEDGAGFRFTPEERLLIDTQYQAALRGDVRSAGGGIPALLDATYFFSTVPLPAVVRTYPENGAQNHDAVYSGVTFTFTSPMDIATLEDRFVVEPAPAIEYDAYYNEWDNSYVLNFYLEPSTDYAVTLEAGARDIYGNEITQPTTIRFTTGPLQPSLMLEAPQEFGFYSAYNDATELFTSSINVSALDFALYALQPADAMLFAGGVYDAEESLVRDLMARNRLGSWQIRLDDVPLNALRYELVNLGTAALGTSPDLSLSCPTAPATRLSPGDIAVVISDPDPVRARSAPVDGEILELLYTGTTLEIIGSAVCANDIIWWPISLPSGEDAWVAEGITGEYFLDLSFDSGSVQLEIENLVSETGALQPGLYLLEASTPETLARGYLPFLHVVVIATTNLAMYAADDTVTIWATDVQTGLPVPNLRVDILDDTGTLIGSGGTDADGLVTIDAPAPLDEYGYARSRTAVTRSEDGSRFGMSMTGWIEGTAPWYFGVDGAQGISSYRGYLYTDRPIYRPGQPVYFRGIVREKDDVRYFLPDESDVEIGIFNEMGERIYSATAPLTEFGTFSGQFDLAEDAALGYYTLAVRTPGSTEFQQWSSEQVGFGVADYRAPEFEVGVTPESAEVSNGDVIRVEVDARYYFGGSVSGGSAEYNVVATPYVFDYTGRGNYSFDDVNYDYGASDFFFDPSAPVASGEITLDGQGRATIEIPAALENANRSMIYTIELTVTDESALAVSGRAEVVVHKGDTYVGVAAESYVSTAGQPAALELITVDWDSQPVSGQTVVWTAYERRWNSVQEQDDFGRTTWSYEVEEIEVASGEVTTGADGTADFSFTPETGGTYKIFASLPDGRGGESASSQIIWVSSPGYVTWRQQNSNRIDLVADQTDYEIGDTAEILITSPFQGTSEALIVVARGDVLTTERITLETNSYVHRLDITEDFAPNVYVSAFITSAVNESNTTPSFRMGIVNLNVERERKEITVEVTPETETGRPGETIDVTVTTVDYAGNPVSAEVGIGLSDVSVLSIAPPNSGLLMDYFYDTQGLGVVTSTLLNISVDQRTQEIIDTIKGGGGGFGEGGIFDIREEFIDTPYWNPVIVTDENGTATFTVRLPDNLTTWRFDARAVTDGGTDGGMLVGQTTFDIVSTIPVLVRPVTPRFMVVGDTVNLAAVVNNNTDEDVTALVSLVADGVTPVDGTEMEQMVSIAAGGRARVAWPVIVDDVDSAGMTFFVSANDGEYIDASVPPLGQGADNRLPVYDFVVPQTTATSGVAAAGETVTESVLIPAEATTGSVDLTLSPSLASAALDALDVLEAWPYESTESIVSRFLPNIATWRALAQADLDSDLLTARVEAEVVNAVQRLLARQKVDGGWGWSMQDSSQPITTAYAVIGLSQARAAGFTVPDGMIERAVAFLTGSLRAVSESSGTGELNRQVFIAYALSEAGQPPIDRLSNLFELRSRLSVFAQALLALSFHAADASDGRAAVLLTDLAGSAILSGTGAHWEESYADYGNWNTDTRATAMALRAFIAVQPESDLVPNILRWLMAARVGDGWETTQETAWSVLAVADWLVASGDLDASYGYLVSAGGEQVTDGLVTRQNVLESASVSVDIADLSAQASDLIFAVTEGTGNLYYTAALDVSVPVADVNAVEDRGIIVQRSYSLADDPENTPITSAPVGANVRVRLSIIVPNSLEFVVVTDPIPAGSDAVNPNLLTSQQVGTRPEFAQTNDTLSAGWGWWWFSNIDFRDEAVVLSASYLPAGTYEFVYTIRTGLAGEYNVIPAVGQQVYFPEVYGRSAGTVFTITE
jgi:alpha-2-macroglobulin